ncbi:PEP-CTERM sorting domain-containing protein [Psychromonas sp. MB-3u-54]|uniref:PEP-CTERM sorting domain-containing protein n=1 Tax=Psychromonas sp. MB-3u-54 TaxID=2058319 RepID=UPI0012FEC9E2|nr:PEP-CTERM sorting domain-containing protein [Psychromonas sp. MB-3u-54]
MRTFIVGIFILVWSLQVNATLIDITKTFDVTNDSGNFANDFHVNIIFDKSSAFSGPLTAMNTAGWGYTWDFQGTAGNARDARLSVDFVGGIKNRIPIDGTATFKFTFKADPTDIKKITYYWTVPEPNVSILLGFGLLGIWLFSGRRKQH